MKVNYFYQLCLILFLSLVACEFPDDLSIEKSQELLKESSNKENVVLSDKSEREVSGRVIIESEENLPIRYVEGNLVFESSSTLIFKYVGKEGEKITAMDGGAIMKGVTDSGLFEDSYKELKSYALEKYKVEIEKGFESIEFYRSNKAYAILYTFRDNNEVLQSVLYLRDNAGGKTYEINCYGDCDCREQFNFDTNLASCSCDDCKMTVVEVVNNNK